MFQSGANTGAAFPAPAVGTGPYPAGWGERRRPLDPSAHLHDGFYLRLAGGIGAFSDYITVNTNQFALDGDELNEGDASGFSGATEVAAGATILPGLVVGLGIYTNIAPAPEAETTLSNSASFEFAPSQLAIIAAFTDYYPFVKKGLHVQVGIGLATYVMGTGHLDDAAAGAPKASAHTGLGTGVMLGAGYEAWIGEQWGMGVLGRMTRGFSEGSDASGVTWDHDTVGWAVLLSVTHH